MIRCSCGEFYGSACYHAEHKKITGHPDEHRVVCSYCGEEFTSYPLPEKGVHIALAGDDIVWTLCDKCMADRQSITTNVVDLIIAYESGELTEIELINLFQDLITSGLAGQLQGSYGRMAMDLVNSGWCFYDLKWKGEYYNGN